MGADTTKYILFAGKVLAERKANGDWSDYIYAGDSRIARADTYEDRIHISGVECSACGWQWEQFNFSNGGGLAGYVVRAGDKLYFRQWQATGTRAGMNLVFTDGTETFGAISDQDGQLIDADSFQQVWRYRRVDLSPYAGKTFSQVRLVVEGLTQPGQWHAFYQDIVLLSADGTVQPLYSRQKTIPLSPFGTSGMTQVSYEVNHISPAGQWPTATTTYYHGDHLGSARLLSSENGYPVWQATYLPFGQEWNPQITVNNYKFTAKERDAESGLDNFGARYDSSGLGRFMSPDEPFADQDDQTPQSWNLYSYVRNNPLRFNDPDGRACVQQKDGSFKDDNSGGQSCKDAEQPQKIEVRATPLDPSLRTRLFDREYKRHASEQFQQDLKEGRIPITRGEIPIAPPALKALGAAEEIIINSSRLKHILNLHTILRLGPNGKSAFAIGEDVVGLIKNAESALAVAQAGGNFARVVDAGRVIGMTRTGVPTTVYTVITNAAKELVTAFPGTP